MSSKPRHPEKVNKPFNPIKKKPEWIRSKIVDSQIFFKTKQVVNQNNLVTVCQEANCPNITECWSKKHATFMIMGDTCTRACAFCDVKTGKPTELDIFEPAKIAKAVQSLNLKHVVITSVDRDDLEDGGSEHFYKVVKATREKNPETSIEVLTPDFLRKGDAYKKVLKADLDVFNHNIETVPRLYTKVRPGARYFASLELLKNAKKFNKKVFTKSGIMVGLGEIKEEVIQVMAEQTKWRENYRTLYINWCQKFQLQDHANSQTYEASQRRIALETKQPCQWTRDTKTKTKMRNGYLHPPSMEQLEQEAKLAQRNSPESNKVSKLNVETEQAKNGQ